jgi:hypothetical protein
MNENAQVYLDFNNEQRDAQSSARVTFRDAHRL